MVLSLAGLMTNANIPKMGEQVIVVFKTVVLRNERDANGTRSIEQVEMLCQNTRVRYTGSSALASPGKNDRARLDC
jgi:hypothetical protein